MSNPTDLVQKLVESFAKCIYDDVYPAESVEKIFGVVMPKEKSPAGFNILSESLQDSMSRMIRELEFMPMGKLVLNIWVGLFKSEHVNQKGITDALRKGSLPQYFEGCVRKQNKNRSSYYIQEILRRGFETIPWDREIHFRLVTRATCSTPPTPPSYCQSCGKTELRLFRCSACRSATYCSKECQCKNWKEHKPVCIISEK